METPPQPPAVGRVVPHRLKWHQKPTAFLVSGLLKTATATWRKTIHDRTGYLQIEKSGKPVIYCIWHNRLAISMYAWTGFVRRVRPGQGLVAFISASRDGGLLAEVLSKFGVEAVRGSTSRRGRQALLEAVKWMEKGYNVAVTPDGPRGPKYIIQDGILALAQVTGFPIIPVTAQISFKRRLKSWDQFQVPLPFARCDLFFHPPLFVPREPTEEEREQIRQELHRRMTGPEADL